MNRAARRVVVVASLLAIAFSPTDVAAATKPGKTAKAPVARPPDTAALDAANPRDAQREQSAERDRLTARIADLKRQIAAGEKSRTGAAAALKRAEQALAAVDRRLDELARRQREGEERIAGLDRQRGGTERQIAQREAAFAATARSIDANALQDPVRVFLAGGDPAQPLVTDIDLGRVAKAEAADLDALHGRVRDLQSQRQRADDERRALVAQADAQRSTRDDLAASQAAQQKTLAQLSQQLADQRRTADALAADEKRLTRVVEQLQRVIERQAAEERAKRDAARRQAEQQAARRRREPTSPTREPAPMASTDVPDETTGTGAFAQLRGQLRLPVRGTVTGRFGAPRGTGGGTWKGVFVRTQPDADVHAVAAGKVVFADDLRGFGKLVIVDHGDQYLSIYGNNDALLKRSGDTVRAGDVVARAGDSSGDGETGLYFELRFRGRPFDPMSWSGGR